MTGINIGLFVVVIIVMIYYNNLNYQFYALKTLMGGFYEADRSFCEEAEIDMFCLYLDNDVSYNSRACYVLAKKDDEVIINEPTIAYIKPQWCLSNFSTNINSPKYFNIVFENINEDCVEVFPKVQELKYYPLCNKLVLYSGETVTAVLYKNPVYSELKSDINPDLKNDIN